MLLLSSIFIYPIKSLSGISLHEAIVTPRGLQYDRWWMLVDEKNQFLSQRTHPQLALFQTDLKADSLIISILAHPGDHLELDLDPRSGDTVQVHIWDDVCTAMAISQQADQWFSRKLGQKVRLVYMPETAKRMVDADYAKHGETTGFADGFPVLLIGQSSLDDLNSRLTQPVTMNRFRPNLVFTGGLPYQEDVMRQMTIGEFSFRIVKPCARCSMTTIDPLTGLGGQEPLRTLASYRSQKNKVYFGQNCLVESAGVLFLGDELTVLA